MVEMRVSSNNPVSTLYLVSPAIIKKFQLDCIYGCSICCISVKRVYNHTPFDLSENLN